MMPSLVPGLTAWMRIQHFALVDLSPLPGASSTTGSIGSHDVDYMC